MGELVAQEENDEFFRVIDNYEQLLLTALRLPQELNS